MMSAMETKMNTATESKGIADAWRDYKLHTGRPRRIYKAYPEIGRGGVDHDLPSHSEVVRMFDRALNPTLLERLRGLLTPMLTMASSLPRFMRHGSRLAPSPRRRAGSRPLRATSTQKVGTRLSTSGMRLSLMPRSSPSGRPARKLLVQRPKAEECLSSMSFGTWA